MTSLQIRSPFLPTTDDAISQVEHTLGVRLPEDYRQFLLEYNGGHPVNPIFHLAGQPREVRAVARFYGLGNRRDWADLRNHLSGYEWALPSELLPIAYDPGSNLICMTIRGPKTGVIYFYETDGPEEDGPPNYDGVDYVADSFTEFINGLKPEDVEEE